MRVLLVTSWDTSCGIAEHSRLLKEYVERADPGIEIIPSSQALDPDWLIGPTGQLGHAIDLLHLNHHDALHSRWTPEHVTWYTERGIPVVVTYHDTTAGVSDQPSSPKLKAFTQVASSTIVHEPVGDIKAIYWRQGVPDAAGGAWQYGTGHDNSDTFKAYDQQPVLGTVGFNFPWKNYDRLCQVTAEVGWAMTILANNATEADVERWRTLNPHTRVVSGFRSSEQVIARLAGCDATVFAYECANTGTSGAIRLGVAARKPVLAFQGCRQFRDLLLDQLGRLAICWVDDWYTLGRMLSQNLASSRYDPSIVHLAYQDSWERLGYHHAALYHALVHGAPL
jgi:hypothetical protein